MTRKERRARGRAAAKKRWDKVRALQAQPAAVVPAVRAGSKISYEAMLGSTERPRTKVPNIFTPASFPKAALPPKSSQMAMDASIADYGLWAYAALSSLALEGQTFLGYPVLAELAQRPEYRRIVEQLAYHMTRRFIRLVDKAAQPDTPKRPGIEDEGPLKDEDGNENPFLKKGAKKNGANGKAPPFGQDAFPDGVGGNGDDQQSTDQLGPDGKPVKLSAAGTPLVEPEYTQEDAERDARAGKLAELEKELKRLRLKQHLKEVVEHDGFFGRGHLFVDIGSSGGNEMATSIGNGRDDASKLKVKKGALKGLKTVEPMWVYPMQYEASDPLKPDWYRPNEWYVMKRNVHRTRLLTFVSREVSDVLKPAYGFGGLPMTQMARPYVDNWLRTRQSVSDLLVSFSQFVLKTDLIAQISTAGGARAFYDRLDLFNNTRSNRGVLAVDKEREDLTNVSAPLGSLDELQRQSQEQMAAVSGIPILFLLGDSPSGMNASSEGVIRAFYDWVESQQEFLFGDAIESLLGFAMLNIWGEIDEDISYEFVQLWTPTDKELAETRKADADRDAVYLGEGVLDTDEVRERLAKDPNSGYTLDLSKEIEPPPPEIPPGLGLPGAPGAPDGDGDEPLPGLGGLQ